MQAYFVTEDAYFYDLFCRHAAFLSTAQIHSQDPRIDGAWARGFDAEQMEVCGLPNDVGWGPGPLKAAGPWPKFVPACCREFSKTN